MYQRWSGLRARLLEDPVGRLAGKWLAGALFWPVWLRCSGMKVGSGAEISTIINVVPELIEIGKKSFLADGIYLGGPAIHRGAVTLASTTIGDNTFLGNHVIIAAGQHLPRDILLGVCTVADEEAVRPGSAWFGHPRSSCLAAKSSNVTASSPSTNIDRLRDRVFWEMLRFGLPILPVLTLSALVETAAYASVDVSLLT